MNDTAEVDKQVTYKVDEFELPGLAIDKDGKLTHASMLDVLFQCLAALGDDKIDEIMKSNGLVIRDNNGKLFFPRPR